MLDLKSLQQILDVEGERMISQIQANMIANDVNATGETSASLEYSTTKTVDGFRFEIKGNEAFNWIEGGRGATKQSQGGVLYGNILDWVFAKGIDIGDESPEAVAAKITNVIHQSGTLLHILGETRDVYSSVFSDNEVENLITTLEQKLAGDIEDVIFKQWSL